MASSSSQRTRPRARSRRGARARRPAPSPDAHRWTRPRSLRGRCGTGASGARPRAPARRGACPRHVHLVDGLPAGHPSGEMRSSRRICACISRTRAAATQPRLPRASDPGWYTRLTNRPVSESRRGAATPSRPEKTSGLLPAGLQYPATSERKPSTRPPKKPVRRSTSPPLRARSRSAQNGSSESAARRARSSAGSGVTSPRSVRSTHCSRSSGERPLSTSTAASARGSPAVRNAPSRSTRGPNRRRASSRCTNRVGNMAAGRLS